VGGISCCLYGEVMLDCCCMALSGYGNGIAFMNLGLAQMKDHRTVLINCHCYFFYGGNDQGPSTIMQTSQSLMLPAPIR